MSRAAASEAGVPRSRCGVVKTVIRLAANAQNAAQSHAQAVVRGNETSCYSSRGSCLFSMDSLCDGHFPRISLSAASRLATISARNPNFVLPWFLVDMGHRLGHGGVSHVALRIFTDAICFPDRGPAMPMIRKYLTASCMAWRLRDLSPVSIRSSLGAPSKAYPQVS